MCLIIFWLNDYWILFKLIFPEVHSRWCLITINVRLREAEKKVFFGGPATKALNSSGHSYESGSGCFGRIRIRFSNYIRIQLSSFLYEWIRSGFFLDNWIWIYFLFAVYQWRKERKSVNTFNRIWHRLTMCHGIYIR